MSESSKGTPNKKRTNEFQSSASSKPSKGKHLDPKDRLSDEAYKLAVKATTDKENIFPYIPVSTKFDLAIEQKYTSLKPEEIADLYTRNFGLPQNYPRYWDYYQGILTQTDSVAFEHFYRGSSNDIAYSKMIIKRVISPTEWIGDLFSPKPLKKVWPVNSTYNYFDYIQAWESALYYENRQKRFSWWIQFQMEDLLPHFPNWFLIWFQNWGLYPICCPIKVGDALKRFTEINPSLKHHRLYFTVFYKIPWIVRWEFCISGRSGTRFGEDQNIVPWLSRRVYLKWWDKYIFEENSTLKTYGIKSFEKAIMPPAGHKEPEKDTSGVLEGLIASIGREKLISLLQQPGPSSSTQGQASTSHMEEDEVLQDSQDPFL